MKKLLIVFIFIFSLAAQAQNNIPPLYQKSLGAFLVTYTYAIGTQNLGARKEFHALN